VDDPALVRLVFHEQRGQTLDERTRHVRDRLLALALLRGRRVRTDVPERGDEDLEQRALLRIVEPPRVVDRRGRLRALLAPARRRGWRVRGVVEQQQLEHVLPLADGRDGVPQRVDRERDAAVLRVHAGGKRSAAVVRLLGLVELAAPLHEQARKRLHADPARLARAELAADRALLRGLLPHARDEARDGRAHARLLVEHEQAQRAALRVLEQPALVDAREHAHDCRAHADVRVARGDLREPRLEALGEVRERGDVVCVGVRLVERAHGREAHRRRRVG
jgi:hypothetical protein